MPVTHPLILWQARGCPLNHQELNEIFDLTDYLDRGWVSAEEWLALQLLEERHDDQAIHSAVSQQET